MFVDHKQQWKERSFRQSVYLTPKTLREQVMNPDDYRVSGERNELPNKFRKVDVPHVTLESLQKIRNGSDVSIDSALSHPERQTHTVNYSLLKSPSLQRVSYIADPGQIQSVEEFFKVYKEVRARQKKLDKVVLKQKLDQRRQRIDDIHASSVRSFTRTSMGNIRPLHPSYSNLENVRPSQANTTIKVAECLEYGPSEKVSRALTPTNYHSRQFLRGHSPIEEERTSPPTRSSKKMWSLKDEFFEGDALKGMTDQQMFTEKVVEKHFMSMTVSPKMPRQHASSAQKERNYRVLFKDAKVMDQAVETSMQKVYKMVRRKLGTASTRNQYSPAEVSGSIGTLTDEYKEMGTGTQNDFFSPNSKAEHIKKGRSISKEIVKHIKKIDVILNTGMSKVQSPSKIQVKSLNEIMQVKNRLPLRSTIAQKYNFREKLREQKSSSIRLKEASNSYEKSIKISSMANHTCLSSC